MRIHIPCTALGLALFAGAPAAHAQTVITRQIVTEPVETVVTRLPVRTVETIRTVRVGPRHYVRHRVVATTRRVIVRESIAAAPVAVPASPPLYDEVVPATAPVTFPTAPPLYDTTAPPLYDDVAAVPAAVPAAPPLYDEVADAPAPLGATVPFYRYVYQPDRILVIDPATGIAVQSIPR
jgi:hypothetical protein